MIDRHVYNKKDDLCNRLVSSVLRAAASVHVITVKFGPVQLTQFPCMRTGGYTGSLHEMVNPIKNGLENVVMLNVE